MVLENLHVFDVATGEMTGPCDLRIEAGRIMATAPSEGAVTRIDCSGKFVVPGLCDCHTHLAMLTLQGEDHTRKQLRAFVEGGVTHVRDVGGPVEVLQRMHGSIASKEQAGPMIFYCGPMLEKSPLLWAEHNEYLPGLTVAIDTQEAVDKLLPELVAKGASMIKTFNKQDPEVYKHLVEKAAALSLPIVHDPGGPLFHQIPMDKALALGITSIEHGKAPWPVVLKDGLQKEHDALQARQAGKMERMPFMMKVFDRGLDSVSMEKLDKLCDLMLEKKAFLCPTLQASAAGDEEELPEDIPEKTREMMKQSMETMNKISSFFTAEFTKRQVKLLVGHDGPSPEGIFIEMELLQKCGVSEAEILKGATLYPAQWLGVEDRMGSITPGKEANLLVLDENPLDDIKNIRTAFLVMQKGTIVFRKDSG